MEDIVPVKIQIASIVASVGFLLYVGRLILKGRLREEYAIVWGSSTLILLLFSFWREGLGVIAEALGVFYAPSLVFMGAIFIILVYLLHISVVVSRLQTQNKTLAQEIALLREMLERQLKPRNEVHPEAILADEELLGDDETGNTSTIVSPNHLDQ